jgi:hypothetical protein
VPHVEIGGSICYAISDSLAYEARKKAESQI